jgi:hypothetical protein
MAEEPRAAARRVQPVDRLPVACFAPPLTEDVLAGYRALADDPPADLPHRGEVADALRTLLACVERWWGLPASKRTDGPVWYVSHRGRPGAQVKTVQVRETPLEDAHVAELWDVTPWMRELDGFGGYTNDRKEYVPGLFDLIPNETHKEVRDAAYHLLWYCKELTLDREPLTRDVLPGA